MFIARAALLIAVLATTAGTARAAGPDAFARAEAVGWPEPFHSAAAFDRASRAEILVFAPILNDFARLDEAGLKSQLHIKHADPGAVAKVSSRLMTILAANYRQASASCVNDEPFCMQVSNAKDLVAAGQALHARLPEAYRSWYASATDFLGLYARELMRMAALFPTVNSEVDTYSELERTGEELPDRHFLLTFDDGPTEVSGQTDKLLSTVAIYNIHAIFFMLGERLQTRLARQDAASIERLYRGQCTAAHGWLHNSHARWNDWKSSILNTDALVKETFPEEHRAFFRPPYGQRPADSGPFFSEHGLKVALWNIDSQDWAISGEEAAQRVSVLMRLWRRGIILFHDIHPKAAHAVPWLYSFYRKAGVVWDDCRNY